MEVGPTFIQMSGSGSRRTIYLCKGCSPSWKIAVFFEKDSKTSWQRWCICL